MFGLSYLMMKDKIYIKVNIRSRGPVINEIAMKYNGGGHKLASGARIKSPKISIYF